MKSLKHIRDLWMRLQEELGREYLDQPLESAGWTFAFDKAKTRFGNTNFGKKRVTVSERLLRNGLSFDQIEDTLRHEIAHVLDYEDRGTSDHTHQWKKWARRCGADPSTTGHLPEEVKPDYRWWLWCPECEEKVSGFYRKPKLNKIHKTCRTKLELRKGPAHPDTKSFTSP
jgi:predicted SprT family Zn-dependent metalloprotease